MSQENQINQVEGETSTTMAHNNNNDNKQQTKGSKSGHKKAQQATVSANEKRQGTPMIVERVNKIPAVHFAISLGCTQYDRLKASNVTIGQVMAQAEGIAAYLWHKVSPYVTKLQEPIEKADQIACSTLDFVEAKIEHVKTLKSQAVETLSTGSKTQM